MSYRAPIIQEVGLTLEREQLTQQEVEARFDTLRQQGYEGWAQWTSVVTRINATLPLPQNRGPLLVAECVKGDTSYHIQQQGRIWSLTKAQKTAGDTHLMSTRSFVKVEPGDNLALDDLQRYQSVVYEIFWERTPASLMGEGLQSDVCEQPAPVFARLASF